MNQQEFSLEELKRRFHITDDNIRASGLTVDEYTKIYRHYLSIYDDEIERVRYDFLSEVFLKNVPGVHSVSSRCKDAYHLIEKIIRKKSNNDAKYRGLNAENYYKFITDLIGVRLLIVYKSDWIKVHNFLLSKFENNEANYLSDDTYLSSFVEDVSHTYIAERPKVYIRPGDDEHFYAGISGIKLESERGYYRSIHYIIKYGGYYIEVQVRSIFEEAWGEVDHDVLYPLYKDSKCLVQYSKLLNRLAGLADEMSDYFKHEVKKEPSGGFSYRDVPDFLIEEREDRETQSAIKIENVDEQLNISVSQKTLKGVEDEVLEQ